jgi:hypothetical protein
MTTPNHTIRIFPKHYVGFTDNRYPGDVVPFAFMTHYEDNAAGRKRQAQVDNWSRGKMTSVIIDNKPMIGFRISRGLRRLGWNHHATSVRIEDPRGFEVDISVSNMMMLTDNNLLENGEILRECVWGRDGGANVLLPVNSSPYVAATVNTERMTTTVNSRTVALGDTVLLKNGLQGRYLGSMYPWRIVHGSSAYRQPYQFTLEQHDKKYHMVQIKREDGSFSYTGFASLGASSIVESNPMTVQEVNELMASSATESTFNIPKIYSPKMFTSHPGVLQDITFEPLDIVARRQAFQDGSLKDRSGVFYGKHKLTGKMYRFYNNNLEAITSANGGRRYLNNVGYVTGPEFHGEEMTIDTNNGITMANTDTTMDEDDCEYFLLTYNLYIPKIDQTVSIRG